MAQATAIRLTGDELRIDDVWAVAYGGASAALSDEARTKMRAARELVERAAHGTREHTYGINTGFGRFVSKSIPEEQTEELQLRLLRSHACGVGDPYPEEIVRAAMLLRANALAKGTSGARVETVELLLDCLRHGVVPRVPSRGSVGASGDLAPLAHLALPLVGEGEADYNGELLRGADALAAAGLEPTRLEAKEGLSLINGTQFMAAYGALGLVRAHRLARAADLACSLSLEALQGSRTSFLPQIHALRPLRGQAASASNVLRLIEGSAINEAHKWCDKVQDAYSLRCAPQVHGASRDLLAYVEATVAVELNAATDNPLVLVEDELLVSNGNFHGPPVAFALDALAMASSELANISERRVERLVNPNLSDGLPAFLTSDGGAPTVRSRRTSRPLRARFGTARSSRRSRRRWASCDERHRNARRAGRRALRRPLADPRAARDGPERAPVVDGGPAAHAAEQSRPRGRREAGGAHRLRRLRPGRPQPPGAASDRRRAPRARRGRDPARAIGEARRRLHDARGCTACLDRELAAGAQVGDVGRIPASRGG